MNRYQFAFLCLLIVMVGFGSTLWQTLTLEARSDHYRAAMICRQDRNFRALNGERGLQHACDTAGR